MTKTEIAKRLLELRQLTARTSVAKYQKILGAAIERDGFDWLTDMFQFCGAGRTGRYAGRLVQLQNLPARGLGKYDLPLAIEAFKAGCADWIYADPMRMAAACVRPTICAPPGYEITVADLSNIEGRVNAWVCGEEWKTQAFRDFDDGVGPDLYNLIYSKSFDVPLDEVTYEQRAVGKVMELACLAEGSLVLTDHGLIPIEKVPLDAKVWDGVEWVSHEGPICKGSLPVIEYRGVCATPDHEVWTQDLEKVTLEKAMLEGLTLVTTSVLTAPVLAEHKIPLETTKRVSGIYRGPRRVWDLLNCGPRHRFTVSGCLASNCGYGGGVNAFQVMAVGYGVEVSDEKADEIKIAWRGRHPKIVAMWKLLDHKIRLALANVGKHFHVNDKLDIAAIKEGGHLYLTIHLPSGRKLCYFRPTIDEISNDFTYWGWEQTKSGGRAWLQTTSWGGKVLENICQAIARDILFHGMAQAQDRGLQVFATVHDELLTLARLGFGDPLGVLIAAMVDNPSWAPDLPLAADGKTMHRYAKS